MSAQPPDPRHRSDAEEKPVRWWHLLFGTGIGPALGASVVLASGSAYGATHTAEPWRVLLSLLVLVYTAYAVYLVAVVAATMVAASAFAKLDRGETLPLSRHWPLWVWPVVLTFVLGWPLEAWLSGYDSTEWVWSGLSDLAAVAAVIAIFFRRARR